MSWTDTQLNILEYTLSSLLRRKGKNLGLLVVYTLVVMVLASVMFFTASVRQEAALLLTDSPAMLVQRTVAGRQTMVPASYINKISAIRGVQAAKGRLWGYHYDSIVGANYTLIAQDKFKHGRGEIVIGSGIARSRLVGVGDVFPFRTATGKNLNLRVAEIMPASSELVASDIMLMSEADFRELFDIPKGEYTDIAVEVRNPRELQTIAQKISDELPEARPIIRDEILRTYEAIFNWRGGMVIVILAGAVLAFIIFAWDKASGLSAEERREIGILKAVGWETGDILRMKFFEGASVSVTAFLLGVLGGYAHVFLFDAALFAPALKGWSVLYPHFKLLPDLDPYELLSLFCLTVVPYSVATIVPSWRAAITDPDAVMRE